MPVIKNVLIWDSSRRDAQYGDIVIGESGLISAVTPPGAGRGDVVYNGGGRCLALPGLVNAHTHVSMTLLRGIGEELPLMEWLHKKIFPAEEKLTACNIRSGADLAMLEMISGGVTCFCDMYYFMDEVAASLVESGMRGALCRGLTGDDDQKISENLALAEKYDGFEGRVAVQLGPHAPYTVPRDAVRKIADIAREKNLGVHFHWLETKSELDTMRDRYKTEPAEYLESTGLLEVRELILAHSVWFPEEQISCAARDNVTVVHNPKSNLKLGSGFAPVRGFLSAGVRVALGTDGAASNNRLDIWDEMRTAALMHKGYHMDPTATGAKDVLRMATVGGARGAGFKNTGLLQPDFTADIIIVDTDNPRYVGLDETNVPEFAVYAGSSRDVRASMVAGRMLYKDGEFLTLDREKILRRAGEDRRSITKNSNFSG
ncbi:MAG: amidohydrolase [Synergistaceae bacterium]|jgi:5-methylthioadenosine/S-adenosylhomocysteine deaminase|nr:amidohydrolase [Synergistaceae bacterium]